MCRCHPVGVGGDRLEITYIQGSLGYPDACEMFSLLPQYAPDAYAAEFADRAPEEVGKELEMLAKEEARAAGNINDFYKKPSSSPQGAVRL